MTLDRAEKNHERSLQEIVQKEMIINTQVDSY